MRLPPAWRTLRDEENRSKRREKRIRDRVRQRVAEESSIDPATSAQAAGLRYVSDLTTPGVRRVGRKRRWRYLDPNGRSIRATVELERIRALVIPPAWTDVWICPDPHGHLQATGRDARGRKQYRYHAKWRVVRDEVKYGRLAAFAAALPAVRRRTAADLRRPGLPREKVLAAVVQLLEKTLIRVGNEEYARDNHSIGLTTMRDRHARINGDALRFEFLGKSGIAHVVDLRDQRLAKIVKACRALPGQELFQYVDSEGSRQSIGSVDVNAYLKELTAQDFTAKDFRTWAGTVLAAKALADAEPPRSKAHATREIARAITSVAESLGNTKSVCRKCYIHPAVIDAYGSGVTIEPSVAAVPRRSRRASASRGRTGKNRASDTRCRAVPRTRGLDGVERAVVALISA